MAKRHGTVRFGAWISKRREQLGYTKREVTRRVNEATNRAYSETVLIRAEGGDIAAGAEFYQALVRVLWPNAIALQTVLLSSIDRAETPDAFREQLATDVEVLLAYSLAVANPTNYKPQLMADVAAYLIMWKEGDPILVGDYVQGPN